MSKIDKEVSKIDTKNPDLVQVFVTTIVTKAKHGPYGVAFHKEMKYITFSLKSSVWQENTFPEKGEIICLSILRKTKSGWRAKHGRRPTSSE